MGKRVLHPGDPRPCPGAGWVGRGHLMVEVRDGHSGLPRGDSCLAPNITSAGTEKPSLPLDQIHAVLQAARLQPAAPDPQCLQAHAEHSLQQTRLGALKRTLTNSGRTEIMPRVLWDRGDIKLEINHSTVSGKTPRTWRLDNSLPNPSWFQEEGFGWRWKHPLCRVRAGRPC